MKVNIFGIGLISILSIATSLSSISSCGDVSEVTDKYNETSISKSDDKRIPSQQTKDYWYDGTAEISSYILSQARYGELHEGTAVLIYVTEPFSRRSNTKADVHSKDNLPILKLNRTRKFNTGIYPYSMMNSSFFPFEGESISVKISSSMQEWCGMTYLEMKNDGKLNFTLNSYFEGQSFENKKVKESILEDDLWSLIRLNPELLPVGEVELIPSMFYARLRHADVVAQKANITLNKSAEGVNSYSIKYKTLDRSITIRFQDTFPHKVLEWEESNMSGYGADKKMLTTKAVLNKTVKTDYWNQNGNKDKDWRGKLGL